MSPEKIQRQTVDPRSDLFAAQLPALGVPRCIHSAIAAAMVK